MMNNIETYEEKSLAKTSLNKAVKGLENVDDEDIIQPRIKLNQANSPAVVDGIAKPGDFSNSLSDVAYGDKLLFQPIIYGKTRIKWLSDDLDDKGWECRSYDGKAGDVYGACKDCAFSKWATSDKGENIPPPCNVIHNFLSIVRKPDEHNGDMVIISFMRTSARTGQELINRIKYAGSSAWARKYLLTAKHIKTGQYAYYVMNVDSGHPASAEEVEQADRLYDQWAGKQIAADINDVKELFSDNLDKLGKTKEPKVDDLVKLFQQECQV